MKLFRRKAETPQSRKSSAYFLSLAQGKAGLSSATYDQLATEGYAQSLVSFACINMIANAVASVETNLCRKVKGKVTKVDDHELISLMENPNPAQSGREFMRHLVSYHQLAGIAYVLGNGAEKGAPRELQLLNPGKVKIIEGQSLLPAAYQYRPDPAKEYTFPVDQVTGRCAVMRVNTFNPSNHLYGTAALSPAARSVDIHSEGLEWNKRLIQNGARPSGALVVNGENGGTLGDEQYARLKEMIDGQFSGSRNAGRPMLLEGGLDWKEMSLNPKDMEFLEGKNSAARDIALAFGVPPQLLGIQGDNTYSNYSEAKLAFWTDTVLPLLGVLLDAFNRWLVPFYGKDLYFWFDEDTIPALEPLRKAKSERIEAADYMTMDEKRLAMGLETLPDGLGSMVLVPSSMIPLDLAGTTTLAEPGSPATQNVKP